MTLKADKWLLSKPIYSFLLYTQIVVKGTG